MLPDIVYTLVGLCIPLRVPKAELEDMFRERHLSYLS